MAKVIKLSSTAIRMAENFECKYLDLEREPGSPGEPRGGSGRRFLELTIYTKAINSMAESFIFVY
jgi:hypothetical protein